MFYQYVNEVNVFRYCLRYSNLQHYNNVTECYLLAFNSYDYDLLSELFSEPISSVLYSGMLLFWILIIT